MHLGMSLLATLFCWSSDLRSLIQVSYQIEGNLFSATWKPGVSKSALWQGDLEGRGREGTWVPGETFPLSSKREEAGGAGCRSLVVHSPQTSSGSASGDFLADFQQPFKMILYFQQALPTWSPGSLSSLGFQNGVAWTFDFFEEKVLHLVFWCLQLIYKKSLITPYEINGFK